MFRTLFRSSLLLMMMLFLCSPAAAEIVQFGSCGEATTYTLDSCGLLTISGTGPTKNHNSSSYVPWYNVRDSIREVIIEPGVTGIGNRAFSGLTALEKVTLPNSVLTIGSYSFSGCTSLTDVTLPAMLVSIARRGFEGCTALKYISLPDSLTTLGPSVFNGCSSLKEITLPERLSTIESNTFKGCTSLTKLTLGGVDSLGDEVFYGCTALSSVVITGDIGTIGSSVFGNCPNLVSAEFSDGCTFTSRIFSDCAALKKVILADTVSSLSNRAFANCTSLCEIQLPDGLTSIGSSAFAGCKSLQEIDLPDGLESLHDFAFRSSGLTSIYIPDSVTRMGEQVFGRCNQLVSARLSPNSQISYGAFAYCEALKDLVIPEGVPSISMEAFFNCSSLTSLVIPDSVKSIDSWAFCSCSNLASVILPNKLTVIDTALFRNCINLRSIYIPASVTSIGDEAFYNCSSLQFVEFPEGISLIDSEAFARCSSLTKAYFYGQTMPDVAEDAFSTPPTIYCYEYSDVDYWAMEKNYDIVYLGAEDPEVSCRLPEQLQLELGSSAKITPVIFPANAVLPNMIWTSSDPQIVSVDDGLLTALAPGECTITLTCGELTASMPVTVYVTLDSFTLSAEELWVLTKQTAQLDVISVTPAGAVETFSYASSDTAVLTVDETGLITAKHPGDAVITVTSGNQISRECLVHVHYPVVAITLAKESLSLTPGSTHQLQASVTTTTQTQLVNKLVTFSSSNPEAASVDASGIITAANVGTATITVSASGVSASCTVTVTLTCEHVMEDIQAAEPTCTAAGSTAGKRCTLCSAVLEGCEVIPAKGHTNGDPVIMQPPTGTASGTAEFTCTVCEEMQQVEIKPVTAVTLDQKAITLLINGTLQLNASVTAPELTFVNQLVTFTSSDPEVAAVDASGLVTGMGVGTATITATAASGISANCSITVKQVVQTILPAGLTSIDDEAFMGTAVEAISLPDRIQAIGSCAFANCTQLLRIVIPASVTSIADNAFAGCSGLIIIAPEGSIAHTFAVDHEITWMSE